MPTETFLRLSKSKQEKLLKAAKEEFKKHLIEEVSINQIIKNAGIPRGSFYMYFSGKEDIYFYLLSQFKEEFLSKILLQIRKAKGNVFDAGILLYEEFLQYCRTDENNSFLRNVFLNLKYTSEKMFLLKPEEEERARFQQELIKEMDLTVLRDTREEFVFDLLDLIMMLTSKSVAYIFKHPEKEEKEKENYLRRLHMLQYGAYKKEEIK